MSIQTYEPTADLIHQPANIDPTGGRLVAWAQSLFAAKQLADALCRTTFAPAHFRGKPEDAAAAILFGDEIGLTPGQSLQNVTVISGRPGLYARTMVALALSKGHDVWTETDTPDQVTVCGRRKGSSHVERADWTKDRARKAGYTSNKKYETDPQAMLYARAASDVCRKIAPDALAGLAYTVEEMELAEPATTTTVQRTPRATTAKRAQAPQAPEPDLDEPERTAEPAVADGPADLITPPQMRKVQALFKEQLGGDRATCLRFASETVGREVESSKTLTKAEAGQVIDALEAQQAEQPTEQASGYDVDPNSQWDAPSDADQ